MPGDREFTPFRGFNARLGDAGEVEPSAYVPKTPESTSGCVEVIADSPRPVGFRPVPEPPLILMLDNLQKMMTVAEAWQLRVAADPEADLLRVYAEAIDQLRLDLTMAFTEASDEMLVTVPKALGRTVDNLVLEYSNLKDRLEHVLEEPAPKRLKRNSSGPEEPPSEPVDDSAFGTAHDTLPDTQELNDSQDVW